MIDVKLSSASAPTLQGTDCSFTTCSKFNCFFGLSSYVTGSRLLLVLRVRTSTICSASASTSQGTECCLYYVFEIKLFLRPQLLRYREQTVACITRSKFNYFFGLSFYVTGNRVLLLVLCVRNSTVSSASLHIGPPVERGTRCAEMRSGFTMYFRDVRPAIVNCTLKTRAQQFFEMSAAVYHFAVNNIPEDSLFVNVMFWACYFHDSH
jgi:hypothetical protein